MSTFDPEKLVRDDLSSFPAYATSPLSAGELERFIRLDLNENPYGPSPKALAALAGARSWHRYLTQDALRPAIARYVGVETEQIVVGNGADEMIDLVQRIVLRPGDAIVDCPPSFDMYRNFALMNGARVIDVARRETPATEGEPAFAIDMDAIERVVAQEHPKIVFVTNPNNPDGGLLSSSDVERLLALPALIVMDEAYAEFSGVTLASRVSRQPNLVVLRTFSKWAGLAGLRIGYGVASKHIAGQIMRAKSPYNVNAAALAAAEASLDDAEYLLGNVRRIVAERERLRECLANLGFLESLPSAADYVLCHVTTYAAQDIRTMLERRGILIRTYPSAMLREYIRISVGTPEQDDAVVRALQDLGG